LDLKKILPIETYTLTSRVSAEEIERRLFENVEPKKILRVLLLRNAATKPYQGKISDNRFKISRIIRYRNSFRPIIAGHIRSSGGQTLIEIRMRPTIYVIIFMTIWLGMVGSVFLILLLGGIFHVQGIVKENFLLGLFITFLMFLFGWCLTYFGFKYESKKSRQFLLKIFEAQESKQLE
jgi:hypothetical protein